MSGAGSSAARGGWPGAVLAALVVVAGVVGGLAWVLVSPTVRLQQVSGSVVLDETSGAALYSPQGWFAVVALVGGVLIGLGAIPLAARRGWPVVPIAAVAALAAGVLAWRVGIAIDGGPLRPRPGADSVPAPLALSGMSALALWPLGTGAVATLAALIRPRLFDPDPDPAPVDTDVDRLDAAPPDGDPYVG
jgi:hypothetical protein